MIQKRVLGVLLLSSLLGTASPSGWLRSAKNLAGRAAGVATSAVRTAAGYANSARQKVYWTHEEYKDYVARATQELKVLEQKRTNLFARKQELLFKGPAYANKAQRRIEEQHQRSTAIGTDAEAYDAAFSQIPDALKGTGYRQLVASISTLLHDMHTKAKELIPFLEEHTTMRSNRYRTDGDACAAELAALDEHIAAKKEQRDAWQSHLDSNYDYDHDEH